MAVARPVAASSYDQHGYAIARVHDANEMAVIEDFTLGWVRSLFGPRVPADLPFSRYHEWGPSLGVSRSDVLRARNRHCTPPEAVARALLNDSMRELLAAAGVDEPRLWDEGLGWLAFRLIRPGFGDGYPWSRKEWGPAQKVVSAFVPVVGRSSQETLRLVPGSHRNEYESYVPEETQFTRDERRLVTPPRAEEVFSPDLAPGEVLIFHPRTLHTEEILPGGSTRLSLEFRVLAK